MQEIIGTIIWLADADFASLKKPMLYVSMNEIYHLLINDKTFGKINLEQFKCFDNRKVRLTGTMCENYGFINVENIEIIF